MKKNVFKSTVVGLVLLGLTEVGASSLSNQYEKQIAAVTQSYNTILKIENQSKEVQSAPVAQETRAIKYDVQLAAVMQRYSSIIR